MPPLQLLYDGPYAIIRCGGRSFTLKVRFREEIVAISRLKVCTAADAAPSSRAAAAGCWASAQAAPLGKCPGGSAGQVPRRLRCGQMSRRLCCGQTSRQLRRGRAGIVCAPLGLCAFNSSAAAKRSRNRFPTQRGGFCTPGTGGAVNASTVAESAAPADTAAESATPVDTATVSATPADTASEDGPLTSPPLPLRVLAYTRVWYTTSQYTCT